MTQKHKNRSFRRVKVKRASDVTTHYRKRNPSPAKCKECGKGMNAMPRLRAVKAQNTPKTAKRPERPFGGNLGTKCMRSTMVAKARSM